MKYYTVEYILIFLKLTCWNLGVHGKSINFKNKLIQMKYLTLVGHNKRLEMENRFQQEIFTDLDISRSAFVKFVSFSQKYSHPED